MSLEAVPIPRIYLPAMSHPFLTDSHNDANTHLQSKREQNTDAPSHKTLIHLFRHYAVNTPTAVALDDWSTNSEFHKQLTYYQLDVASTNMCQYLRQQGLGPGDIVPILSTRCFGMAIATLAILKARACYVPIDLSSWGKERIEKTLNMINFQIFVSTEKSFIDDYAERCVFLDPNTKTFARTAPLITSVSGVIDDSSISESTARHISDLAYIIFTSGTTGTPKGVMISQKSITAYVQEGSPGPPFNFDVDSSSRVLLICSISFDACVAIMFSTLCNGGTLVLADTSTLAAAADSCSIITLTPSILATLDPSQGYDSVKSIFLGGESPTLSLVSTWASPTRRIFNGYGPTEATCGALMAELKPGLPINVGKPISFADIRLIDPSTLQESEEGELYIGGIGVAVGYYCNPELTERSFVIRNGSRFYKTGDYAKLTPDGIVLCGRRDHFVKNRGILINLEGDVEPAMSSYPKVQSAVAVNYRGRLYGFVTPTTAREGLREYLGEHYSGFLIPDRIYGMDSFPSTTNGKIDRRELLKFLEMDSKSLDVLDFNESLSPHEAVRRAFAGALGVPETQITNSSSFNELGGHSLAAIMVVSNLQKLSYRVEVSRVLHLDSVVALASSLKPLEAAAYADPEWLREVSSTFKPRIDPKLLVGLDIEEIAPMTDVQMRLIRTSIENSDQNYIKAAMTFNHDVENISEALRHAWANALQRHSIFRTSFLFSSGEGVQIVHKALNLNWEETVLSPDDWPLICRQAESLDFDMPSHFDEQNRFSLFNFKLLTVPYQKTRVVWTIHHSLIDGFSVARVFDGVCAASNDEELPAAPRFSDTAFYLQQLELRQTEKAEKYWASTMKDFSADCRLRISPPKRYLPMSQSAQSFTLHATLPGLAQCARKFRITTATILYAAWGTLLSRYTKTDRVVFGAVLSGRNLPLPSIEQIVGPLINTLPFPVHAADELSVSDMLHKTFETLCGMFEFQWSPNALIQRATGVKGTDFFETILALQVDLPNTMAEWKTLKAPTHLTFEESTEAPLTALIEEGDGQIVMRCLYKRSHFMEGMLEQMISQYDKILETFMRAIPSDLLAGVSDVFDKSLLSNQFSGYELADQAYCGPKTLKAAFNSSVQRYSSYTAVEYASLNSEISQLTYEELDNRTNTLAYSLAPHISVGDIVCVLSDGSIEWLYAILAVIKLGAAYCPIDHKLPCERQNLIVSASKCASVIYPNESFRDVNQSFGDKPCFNVQSSLLAVRNEGNLSDREPSPEDKVCLIFTSGSTGVPKGVQLQNIGILSLLDHGPARLHSAPGQRNAQLLSLGFDCCVNEIFSTLCFGATLVLKNPQDPLAHLARVDATMATPSLLSALDPDHYSNLKIITVAGEAVPQSLVDRWGHGRLLQNGYGPAECTLLCLVGKLIPGQKVSIGRPVPRVVCYILDQRLRPVPVGVSGEIFISGIQVTPGYFDSQEPAGENFLRDPLRHGWLMYRTGDIGRWLENGEVEYVGREDNQIKLRGYRIDLGDIEANVSASLPDVRSTAALVIDGNLVIFVSPGNLNTDTMQKLLQEKLPHFCRPFRVIPLEVFPTSSNLKIDRKALSLLPISRVTHAEPLATQTERFVSTIWRKTLGKTNSFEIGAQDNFFDLGGHSLLQIQLSRTLSEAFGIQIPLKAIIQHQILRDLCRALDMIILNATESKTLTFLSSTPVSMEEFMPLSNLEKGLLDDMTSAEETSAFNMPFVARITGNIDIHALSQAFTDVLQSNDILRARYTSVDGTFWRSIASKARDPYFLSGGNSSDIIQQEINRQFNLAEEDPVRVCFLPESSSSILLIVTMAHIVGDATTLGVFLREVSERYSHLIHCKGAVGLFAADDLRSDPQALSYKDWSCWITDKIPDPSSESFWKNYLSELPSTLGLVEHGRSRKHHGKSRRWALRPSLFAQLNQLTIAAEVSQHQLMLAVIALVVRGIARQCDVILGAPFSNRMEPGTENLLGLFLERLPVRVKTDLDNNASIFDLLALTRESSQSAIAHFIPFYNIRNLLGQGSADLVIEVMVAFHALDQAVDKTLQLPDANIDRIDAHARGSKFPLMFEFAESKNNVAVDIEYDTDSISEEKADAIESLLALVLDLVARRRNMGEIFTVLAQFSERF